MQATIHFVSGFLGSGKTTAIVGACRMLAQQGVSTAVVTNDQGRYQVDHAFVEAARFPSVAVSNGCFCCRYDDFEEKVLSLAEEERPDVIFAESVGSCADVVATVVKPFTAFRGEHAPPSTLSTFVDVRMLEARLSERRLPFSDDVLYIFDKQIEEAEVLIINKADLIDAERADRTVAAARSRFPGKCTLLLSALRQEDVRRWWRELEQFAGTARPEHRSLEEMDYHVYGSGERHLAWLDARLTLRAAGGGQTGAPDGAGPDGAPALRRLLSALTRELAEQQAPVGHNKVSVTDRRGDAVKASATAIPEGEPDWEAQLAGPIPLPAEVLLNARVMTSVETLRSAYRRAVDEAGTPTDDGPPDDKQVVVEERSVDAFVPGFPEPQHRL